MEQKDIILTVIFGMIRTFIVLIVFDIATWFYIRVKKTKQRNNDKIKRTWK